MESRREAMFRREAWYRIGGQKGGCDLDWTRNETNSGTSQQQEKHHAKVELSNYYVDE